MAHLEEKTAHRLRNTCPDYEKQITKSGNCKTNTFYEERGKKQFQMIYEDEKGCCCLLWLNKRGTI